MFLFLACIFWPLLWTLFPFMLMAIYLRVSYHFKDGKTFSFLHPACASGGGGEGVLWTAIAALQKCDKFKQKFSKIVIYADKNSPVLSPSEMVERVHKQFGISVESDNLSIVPLSMVKWALRPESIPFLTLLAQAFFSMLLALEAIWKHAPDVVIDTTGLTFGLPVFHWFLGKNCRIGAYVHYPWISTNMISVVVGRQASFNNRSIYAKSAFLSNLKILYYRILAFCYAYAGSCAEKVMVNSKWTEDHVVEIWNRYPKENLSVVYPPVNVKAFLGHQVRKDKKGTKTAVFVAQFRPEKNHKFLIESFAIFLSSVYRSDFVLKLIGSCRSCDDQMRLQELKDLCKQLDIADNVQFCVGIPHDELVDSLCRANVAVHPMVDEHFGIAVVEAMAAGLIVIAHDSGGPSRDILLPPDYNPRQPTGILVSRGCLDKDAFAAALKTAFVEMSEDEIEKMTRAARHVSQERFSAEKFAEGFLQSVSPLL